MQFSHPGYGAGMPRHPQQSQMAYSNQSNMHWMEQQRSMAERDSRYRPYMGGETPYEMQMRARYAAGQEQQQYQQQRMDSYMAANMGRKMGSVGGDPRMNAYMMGAGGGEQRFYPPHMYTEGPRLRHPAMTSPYQQQQPQPQHHPMGDGKNYPGYAGQQHGYNPSMSAGGMPRYPPGVEERMRAEYQYMQAQSQMQQMPTSSPQGNINCITTV